MKLTNLAREFNTQLEGLPDSELTRESCIRLIREKVSGTVNLSNLQILILTLIVSDKNEFQEKVLIDFLKRSSNPPN